MRHIHILDFDNVGVGLQTGDEVNALLGRLFKPVVVGIAAIKDQDGARCELPLARYGDLMQLAVGDNSVTL